MGWGGGRPTSPLGTGPHRSIRFRHSIGSKAGSTVGLRYTVRNYGTVRNFLG